LRFSRLSPEIREARFFPEPYDLFQLPGGAVSGTSSQTGPARGHGFGTSPVFLASVSTILGAVMFLRFGYAVGNVGLLGALLIILLGHMVTVPTALAISEIATNRRVEGGGEYFIISRSFGATIGGAIGISLFLSQAISVGFYMIAFGEAFSPLGQWFQDTLGWGWNHRIISLPATVGLAFLVLTRGASLGVRALWVVVSILALSLVFFFLGSPTAGTEGEPVRLFSSLADRDPFILVFAIVFPAFTGMTAGVGLSGDLANPRRSIPLGVLSATLTGMIVYVAVVVKMAVSAPPELLASDQLVMSRIAIWGPIIPIGLAAATLSSAIGSILVAPRTLQALGGDGTLPFKKANPVLAEGIGKTNEPRTATLVTVAAAMVTVALGNVNVVARIVSMFFMVTYGALCAISFLEHFAARPSYRPSFRSKWYLSFWGAVLCLVLMLQMSLGYALLAIVVMGLLYWTIRATRKDEVDDLAAIFQGVMTQLTRYLQIRLQKTPPRDWRPSVIMISSRTFDRFSPLRLLSWLCHRYGFGTYLHFIKGMLNRETVLESLEIQERLIEGVEETDSAVYMDTIISPSMASALAQSLQVPGVSGMENNTILFEFSVHDPPEVVDEVIRGSVLASAPRMNRLILRHSDHFFGNRKNIHIWLTWHDYRNANLMIILSYILLGHSDWEGAEIHIFAAFPIGEVEEQTSRLDQMISEGRLPIASKNLQIIPTDDRVDFAALIERRSYSADLVILGFTEARLKERGPELLLRHPVLQDVLFVSAEETIFIE
jgi:solute carrier family 12 sodium/potassium/chloride transporter 2